MSSKVLDLELPDSASIEIAKAHQLRKVSLKIIEDCLDRAFTISNRTRRDYRVYLCKQSKSEDEIKCLLTLWAC